MTDTPTLPDKDKPAKKGRGKLLIIVGLIIVLLGGSGAYVFLTNPALIGMADSGGEINITSAESNADTIEFDNIIPMDDIIINIRDREFQRLFKLSISLELLNSEDNPTVQKNIPILLDSFQSHLRGLRISEIEGSRAIYRIKEELIARANIVLHPVRIKNILFSELLVQ